jgi:hypothetical protein
MIVNVRRSEMLVCVIYFQSLTSTTICPPFLLSQKTKVILNVYDLSPANQYLYPIGCGLHHSGVEILGDEYSFASGAGIFQSTPKSAPGAQFRESVELGQYDGGSKELQAALSTLRNDSDFGPDDYHLVRKNCNHFANALSWALLGRTIPPHINRLADIGVCCSCLLPKDLLEHAPVGDTATDSTRGGIGGGNNNSTSQRPSSLKKVAPAFTGSGIKLGSSSNETKSSGGLFGLAGGGSNNNGKSSGDDLVDRREKARKAALARLERNQQDGGGGNTSS